MEPEQAIVTRHQEIGRDDVPALDRRFSVMDLKRERKDPLLHLLHLGIYVIRTP
jgi:hypothetical protein